MASSVCPCWQKMNPRRVRASAWAGLAASSCRNSTAASSMRPCICRLGGFTKPGIEHVGGGAADCASEVCGAGTSGKHSKAAGHDADRGRAPRPDAVNWAESKAGSHRGRRIVSAASRKKASQPHHPASMHRAPMHPAKTAVRALSLGIALYLTHGAAQAALCTVGNFSATGSVLQPGTGRHLCVHHRRDHRHQLRRRNLFAGSRRDLGGNLHAHTGRHLHPRWFPLAHSGPGRHIHHRHRFLVDHGRHALRGGQVLNRHRRHQVQRRAFPHRQVRTSAPRAHRRWRRQCLF